MEFFSINASNYRCELLFYFIHSHIVRQPIQIRKEEKQWQGQEKTSTKERMEDGKCNGII